jgi:hypothetical protein
MEQNKRYSQTKEQGHKKCREGFGFNSNKLKSSAGAELQKSINQTDGNDHTVYKYFVRANCNKKYTV